MSKLISFVIPCYNEEQSLELLHEGIVENCKHDYEIIFIDDGSTDNTRQVIRDLHEKDKCVRLIAFRRNFGKSVALQSGFHNAKGDIIITMDADLQDDPSEINAFIEKIEEGFDVVSGWRRKRRDPLRKRLPSKFFNRITRILSGIKLHDFNCGFKAYRKQVVKSISVYGELHRYIPVLAHRKGFKITEIVVKHQKRKFGKSKYGRKRYLRGFFDSLTVSYLSKYYDKPMHFFGMAGLLFGFVGVGICTYLTVIRIMGEPIGTRPLLILGVVSIIIGMQLFSIGILGDILTHNHFKSQYEENHVDERIQ